MSYRSTSPSTGVARTVVARDANGQPRTYRFASARRQRLAYRRLALAILGLDVPTLVGELRSARQVAHTLARAA